jgi:selenocysteine lyase/cysteine desulfurase
MSVMEHDSNIIPWQMIAQKTSAFLKFVELTET